MKKIISFVFCLFLIFTLASCGGTGSSPSESQDNTSTQDPSNDDSKPENNGFTLTPNIECEIDNNKIYITVPNNVETYSFINVFKIPEDYKWELHWDQSCIPSLNIVSKTVNIEEGNNYLYALFVNKNDESDIYLYEIILHRNQLFKIDFYYNNNHLGYRILNEGNDLEQCKFATPEIEGKHFTNYKIKGTDEIVDNSYVPTSDLSLILIYETNVYTCKFFDRDGTIIYSTSVDYGATVVFVGNEPNSYFEDETTLKTFSNWDKSLDNITKNTDFYPVYSTTTYNYKLNIDDSPAAVYMTGYSINVTIPEKVMGVNGEYYTVYQLGTSGNWVFGGYRSIGYMVENIKLPSTITTINSYAFVSDENGFITEEYSALKALTIPNSVVAIKNRAFYHCQSLTFITYNGTKSDWNNIDLADGWNDGSTINEVRCTDGAIYLS